MQKQKVADQLADVLSSELRENIAAIKALHPMEQRRIREIIRYQILRYLKALQQPKSEES